MRRPKARYPSAPAAAFASLRTVAVAAMAMSMTGCGLKAPPLDHPDPLATTFPVSQFFTPSGYMGDGAVLYKLQGTTDPAQCKARPDGAQGSCYKFSYVRGDVGWAGVFWVYPANNWGSASGFPIRGANFKQVRLWAASEAEGLPINFVIGNIADPTLPNRDRAGGNLSDKLSRTWKQFRIDISGQEFDELIGAFAWSIAYPDALDPTGAAPAVVYLDDIVWDTEPVPGTTPTPAPSTGTP